MPSFDADSTKWPSRENDSAVTAAVGPSKVASRSSVGTDQTPAVPSSAPTAMRAPSGLNASEEISTWGNDVTGGDVAVGTILQV
jgi:hypothetical protein